MYYLSLGTGVGGAIVDTHGLLPGPTGSAGESANLVCADLDGRAFTQTGESTGILVNGGTVITTHGLFNVTATATTETPLDAEQALDAAFSLIN